MRADGEACPGGGGGFRENLPHRHYDIFEIAENPTTLSPDLLAVTFGYDREGTIDRLSIPLEPMVSDIVFRRVGGVAPRVAHPGGVARADTARLVMWSRSTQMGS